MGKREEGTRPPSVPTASGNPSRSPERGGTSPSRHPRRAAQRAQWAHAHAARRGGQPGEAKSPTRAHGPGMRRGGARAARRGGTPGGGAVRRAPAERSRAERSGADSAERSEAEIRPGPADPECVAARRGPRAGASPPGGAAARSRSGAKIGRPAGRPEKAKRGTKIWPCKGQCRGPNRNNWVGQGC